MLAITCLRRIASTAKIVGTNLKGNVFEHIVNVCRLHLGNHVVCAQLGISQLRGARPTRTLYFMQEVSSLSSREGGIKIIDRWVPTDTTCAHVWTRKY